MQVKLRELVSFLSGTLGQNIASSIAEIKLQSLLPSQVDCCQIEAAADHFHSQKPAGTSAEMLQGLLRPLQEQILATATPGVSPAIQADDYSLDGIPMGMFS